MCQSGWSGLRAAVTLLLDVEDHHHLMVLVDGVVTVDGVAALHVTEPDENLDLLVLHQQDVLASEVHVAGRDVDAIALDHPEFLAVDVDGVRPAPRLVGDDPPLELVGLDGEAEWVQSMNGPLTCHWPLPRSNSKVRVTRGVAWLMSGSEIGSKIASSSAALTPGAATGSGSK